MVNNHSPTSSNTDEQKGSRRGFLKGTAAFGFGGLMNSTTTQGKQTQTDENPPWAPDAHDHSGAHGTATRLGEEQPVEQITVDDLLVKDTPFVDVRSYGVVGDGETDDAEAFQAAVDAATPHGVLYVPSSVTLHFESSIDIDLGRTDEEILSEDVEQNSFKFICDGVLNPAGDLGDAIHIHHGSAPYVQVRFEGGGKDPDSDNGMRISDMVGGYFEAYGHRYDGTVLKIDNGNTLAVILSIGRLETHFCGQAIATGPGPSNRPIMGFGQIGDVWDREPIKCPVFKHTYDVYINQYENLVSDRTEQGFRFESCVSIWIDKMALGGRTDITLLTFDKVINSIANSIFAVYAHEGVKVNSCRLCDFNINAWENTYGIVYDDSSDYGGRTEMNRINFNTRQNLKSGLFVKDAVTEPWHVISGVSYKDGQEGPAITIESDTAPHLYLNQVYVDPEGATALDVSEKNDVRISESHIPSINGSPKTINHVGSESGEQETPNGEDWAVGDVVEYSNTTGDSNDGLYLKSRTESWYKIA